MSSSFSDLADEYCRLRKWLFEAALPLWSTAGVDRVRGGFVEKIDHEGRALDLPRRARLNARQLYVFSTVPALGWNGPAGELVEFGVNFILSHFVRPDGTVISVIGADGNEVSPEFNLYDYAFVLFALAAAAPRHSKPESLVKVACDIRASMVSGWKHPVAGFEEAKPRTLPLKANPHMHTLEASLAWTEVVGGDVDGKWGALANEIATLCLQRFLTADGKLLEFFDGNWRPMSDERGRIVEPGHQYEWAWLLSRWGHSQGYARAIKAARRLVEGAEDHGTDHTRGVAFNEIWRDNSVKDYNARLWPQTERIKAWVAMCEHASDDEERRFAISRAATAITGLIKFLGTSVPGLWHENMAPNGSFILENSRGSSLYHIVCAMSEVDRLLQREASSA